MERTWKISKWKAKISRDANSKMNHILGLTIKDHKTAIIKKCFDGYEFTENISLMEKLSKVWNKKL